MERLYEDNELSPMLKELGKDDQTSLYGMIFSRSLCSQVKFYELAETVSCIVFRQIISTAMLEVPPG